jgi:hypothetical protein
MSSEWLQKPPYLDWTLDRWKIGIILLIFGGLLISSLAGPVEEPFSRQTTVQLATLPAGAAIVIGATPTSPATPLPESTPTPGLAATPTPPATAGASAAAEPAQASPTPAATPTSAPTLPLTLANLAPNAIVPADTVRVLFGSAAPNSVVEVRDQAMAPVAGAGLSPGVAEEVVLGVVMVGADGLWQLGPFEALPPGQHVLTLFQLDELGGIDAVSSPVVVTVLATGEEGPLSLASPTIRFPSLGTRLHTGPITFVGSGLPGIGVRLYLDNRQVAEGVVPAREEWRLTPAESLAPGVYVARVAAVNPQGEIIAESAPTVFWVEEAPAAENEPEPLTSPALPLTISSLAYGDRRGQSLVVRGQATPHAGVSAWVRNTPLRFANVGVDGGWQFWLFDDAGLEAGEVIEIRSSLGERLVAETQGASQAGVAQPITPIVLSPQPGDLLTTRRPLIQGLAQPSAEVAILVNDREVARVPADQQGVWAYQLVDPLPLGYSTLSASVEGTWTTPDLKARPVVVTVAPRMGTPSTGASQGQAAPQLWQPWKYRLPVRLAASVEELL